MTQTNQKLVIVTGLSGSGKSIALNALEDLGFYCVDNLPAPLLSAFTTEMLENPDKNCDQAAIGMDVRERETDLQAVVPNIAQIKARGIDCSIIFLEAQDDILLRRYSETRRRHPLSEQGTGLTDAIALEKELLRPMRESTDIRIDTSTTSPHELRDLIRQNISAKTNSGISLAIESFGFKHGIPQNADFMFDTRCLSNPHWQPELRPLTGLDEGVAHFLQQDVRTETMIKELVSFLSKWLGCFDKNDRSYITVAIGCTGGQHRSVYIADQVGKRFKDDRFDIRVKHRELS